MGGGSLGGKSRLLQGVWEGPIMSPAESVCGDVEFKKRLPQANRETS